MVNALHLENPLGIDMQQLTRLSAVVVSSEFKPITGDMTVECDSECAISKWLRANIVEDITLLKNQYKQYI